MNILTIITTDDSSARLNACLNALTQQTTRNDALVVIHNGKKQPGALTKTSHRSFVWFSAQNNHARRTKNVAANRATEEILLFINDDCVIPKGYVAYIKQASKNDRQILYQGKNRFVFPKNDWVNDVFVAIDEYSWMQTMKQPAWRIDRRLTYLHSECFYLKKSTLLQLAQRFAPNDIPLDDGAALSIALQFLGYSFRYAPELDIRHYKNNLTFSSLYKKAFEQGRKRARLEKQFEVSPKIKRLFPQFDSSREPRLAEEAYIMQALSHKSFLFLMFVAGFLMIRRLCHWLGSLIARLYVALPPSIMHST
ncbi:glycosyltransferase family 2 protein [Candidatus Gottesmanbacteria bacterium]|nr:glycosyltransferase family 2 protein [Candidatus Gottesmanbacteria bacterium]